MEILIELIGELFTCAVLDRGNALKYFIAVLILFAAICGGVYYFY